MLRPPPPNPITLIERFAWVFHDMLSGLSLGAKPMRMPGPFCNLLMLRIMKLRARLVHAFNRGPLPPRQPRDPQTPPRAARAAKPPKPAGPIGPDLTEGYQLPTFFAWLLRMSPTSEVTRARNCLLALLAEPDLQAMIAANRSLGRILRPLCHILGIKCPEILRRPRQPRDPNRRRRIQTLATSESTPKPVKPKRKTWVYTPPRQPTPQETQWAFRRFLYGDGYFQT